MAEYEAYHTPEGIRREFLPEGYLERRPLLDKPTEPHPILSLLMDQALTRILLVSDGAVAALKKRTTGSKPGTIAPTSNLAELLDDICGRWHKCRTHRARLGIIKEAQTAADLLCYAPDRSLIRDTKEWREAIAADSRSCRVLGAVWGVNASTIHRIKKRGLDGR